MNYRDLKGKKSREFCNHHHLCKSAKCILSYQERRYFARGNGISAAVKSSLRLFLILSSYDHERAAALPVTTFNTAGGGINARSPSRLFCRRRKSHRNHGRPSPSLSPKNQIICARVSMPHPTFSPSLMAGDGNCIWDVCACRGWISFNHLSKHTDTYHCVDSPTRHIAG